MSISCIFTNLCAYKLHTNNIYTHSHAQGSKQTWNCRAARRTKERPYEEILSFTQHNT